MMPHVPFRPTDGPAPALGADSKVGTTENVFFYFPSILAKSDKDKIMAEFDQMMPVMDRSEPLSVFDGWTVEEKVPTLGPTAEDGETSQVYLNSVGWVDVDAHMRF